MPSYSTGLPPKLSLYRLKIFLVCLFCCSIVEALTMQTDHALQTLQTAFGDKTSLAWIRVEAAGDISLTAYGDCK